MNDTPTEIPLTGGGRTTVSRIGDVVHRQTGPWASSVHALLRHLEAEGFPGAPRVVGSGFDTDGRETISFVHGVSLHPGPWPDEAMFNLGKLLASFHRASASFVPPEGAIWRDWFGRSLGHGPRIIGHGDLGDWNIIAHDHQPVGFIDWEQAGPVDPLVELAQLCWLNAHLFDDDLQTRIGLPPLTARAKKLRYIVDGYGLAAAERARLVPTMIELAIADAANEAVQARLTPDSDGPVEALWAMAWRAHSAAWMGRNRGRWRRCLFRGRLRDMIVTGSSSNDSVDTHATLEEAPSMELTLTFEGRIPAQRTDMSVIWEMRQSFSAQLEKVWGKPPFELLKEWEDTSFAAGAPRFTRVLSGQTFAPIYGRDVGVGIDLDITLLTGLPARKPVIAAGDLDNRVKRIIDALRVPQGQGEMVSNSSPAGSRWYCLVENDDAVLSLKARLGPYLGSDDPATSFAVIRVRPIAIHVTLDNLAMLF